MAITIRKAERRKAKLRIGISGPSGSGKTYSALLLASGMAPWEKIVIIDSENGSGELYSNLGGYSIITLEAPFTPEKYIEAIKAAEEAGMEVIILDSASHEWDGKGGLLEINERLTNTKFKGNSWAAWSETTPRHQRFIEAIVSSPAHIITTQRSKTDTIQTEDKKIKKVGLKDIQREGFEYELTTNFNVDREHHLAIASKDRTELFIDRDPFLIDKKIGEEFMKWSTSGKDVPVDYMAQKTIIMQNMKRLNFTLVGKTDDDKAFHAAKIVKHLTGYKLEPENYGKIIIALSEYKDIEEAHYTYEAAPVPPKEQSTGEQSSTASVQEAPKTDGSAEPKPEQAETLKEPEKKVEKEKAAAKKNKDVDPETYSLDEVADGPAY